MLDVLDLIPLKTNPEASPRLQNLRYYDITNEVTKWIGTFHIGPFSFFMMENLFVILKIQYSERK